jgi:membrane-bound metal-dependent hydrolase YbcI (DUF457 family)
MTPFEHALVGMNGVLACGIHRRHGWPIVAWGAFAAILPDWDALTLVLGIPRFVLGFCRGDQPLLLSGMKWYVEGHRLWGHNLLVTGLLAAVLSALAYRLDVPTRIQRSLARRWKLFSIPDNANELSQHSGKEFWLWIVVGVLASYSHLLMDIFCSGNQSLPSWGVPLLWPFSNQMCACPLLPWGNIGATVILAASMFAMLRWKRHVQGIAFLSLLAVMVYMIGCRVFCS